MDQFFLTFSYVTCFYYYFYNYFTNQANDTTPYVVGDKATDVLSSLTKIAQELVTWFGNNQIKANHLNANCT